jgi:hypothetical protein
MPIFPQSGLSGAEASTRGGLDAALQALGMGLNTARGDLVGGAEAAASQLNPFADTGLQAQNIQAALAGSQGADAQSQAFQDFQFSPAQQFLQQESEQARLRNASATGGLGGNNLKRALSRDATAFGSQAINDRFNQLGQLANRGFQASGALAGTGERTGQGLSQLAMQSGVMPANLISQAAGDVANQRFTTGQNLAQAVSGTGSSLANLQNQLGTGIAGITGATGNNLASLASQTGQNQSNLQTQLANILANISQGAATQAAPNLAAAGQFDAAGILGQNQAIQSSLSQLLNIGGGGFGGGGIGDGTTNSDPFGIGSASIT